MHAVRMQDSPVLQVGLSGVGGLFTEEVLAVMGQVNERPIIMPMSNPTSNTEASHRRVQKCTGELCSVQARSPVRHALQCL